MRTTLKTKLVRVRDPARGLLTLRHAEKECGYKILQ